MKTRDSVASPGPDFLCIGMGKAGTGWLYDQLLYHPDFWMPPIKELHYLDRETPRMTIAKRMLERRRGRVGIVPSPGGRRNFGEPEMRFLEEVHAARGEKMSLDFYASIFRFKAGLMSGDITPSYCAMREELIAQIMARFPTLKIIFLVRDPVARAWSHFAMKNRGDKVDTALLRDPVKFRELLDISKAFRTGVPATFTRKWRGLVPVAQFRAYFFDDLQADPAALRREILGFLGADPGKDSPLDASLNRKAVKHKLEITDEIQAVLVEKFRDELLACAELFGGHAEKWAAKYGVKAAHTNGPKY